MKPSEFKISISVESYDEKPAENYRNDYVAEKRIVSKLLKIKLLIIKEILIAQIEDLNKDYFKNLTFLSFTVSEK